MDKVGLKRLRAVVTTFSKNVVDSRRDIGSNATFERYFFYYDQIATAVEDPKFREYVRPLKYEPTADESAHPTQRQRTDIRNSINEIVAYIDQVVGSSEATMDDENLMRERRFLFLQRVHELARGNQRTPIPVYSTASSLGFDTNTADRVAQYLHGKGLVSLTGEGQTVNLTHEGIVQIEEGIKYPTRETEHFPAVNTINFNFHNVNIHGGLNVQSRIEGSYNRVQKSAVPDELKNLLGELTTEVAKLSQHLSEQEAEQVSRDLEIFTAEVTSPAPRPARWKVSLDDLKAAAGKVAAIAVIIIPLADKIATIIQRHWPQQ